MSFKLWIAKAGRVMRRALIEPVLNPTGKQKESYARFFHTLSAACFIGTVTVTYSAENAWVGLRSVTLGVMGAVFFLFAAPLAKG
ncbi:MAG: hypothetical protein JWQ11_3585 [Rhizobacter sp.]|nr:hypothetical protein [Rhizobacter sp.]